MSEGSPDISVVICAWTAERRNLLDEAIRSVTAQTRAAVETIVVVDHNPELLEVVRRDHPQIRAMANERARGHSGAANTGVAAARGAVVAFLDDDAHAEPEWLAWLADGYGEDAVLGVGGALIPEWETGQPEWFPVEFLWVVGCTYRGLPERRAPVRNLIGANMSVRRQAYLSSGGFREDLSRVGAKPFAGHEPEFCVRLTRETGGGTFLHEPRARVHHHVPAARATWRYFLAHCRDEGEAKAALSHLVGPQSGLESERDYALRVLPTGIVRSLWSAAAARRPAVALRAVAIVLGGLLGAVGFLTRSSQLRRGVSPVPRSTPPPIDVPVASATPP